MRKSLGYEGPEGQPFEVPDRNLAAVLEPSKGAPKDEPLLYERALSAPFGAPPLGELAAGARSVLLLVDDATRHTPVADILPHVAEELERAGVRDEQVTVLTAQGTHRRMTREELERKIGTPFLDRWRVEQHDYRDEENLRHVGETRSGMPVVVNRLLAEADVCVGIGHVGVHGIMGYSGGAKIAIPGVSGAESEASTHWRGSQHPEEELMGVLDTPMRLDIEEGARLAGLDAVFNVVMDTEGRVQRAAYGDPVAAHRELAPVTRDLYKAPLDEPVDVVITDSRPADRDYWQSVKGLYAASLCAKEGGVIVLASPNPEGVARTHPDLLDLAGRPLDEIRDLVDRGRVEDVIAAAVAAFTARIRERSDVLLVSTGVTPEETRRLGFTPAASVQEAVDEAFRRAGRDASVAILKGAGGLLPLVEGRNRHHVERSFERPGARPARLGA